MKVNMSKSILFSILVFTCFILFIGYTFLSNFNWKIEKMYNKMIYVMTEDQETHEIGYYEINGMGSKKNIEAFTPDTMTVLRPVGDRNRKYDPGRIQYKQSNNTKSELEKRGELDENGKIIVKIGRKQELFNTYSLDVILDERGKELDMPVELHEVIIELSKYPHNLIEERILIDGEQIYITAAINAGISNSYVLYYYDKDTFSLRKVWSFNNKEVLGIKVNKEQMNTELTE